MMEVLKVVLALAAIIAAAFGGCETGLWLQQLLIQEFSDCQLLDHKCQLLALIAVTAPFVMTVYGTTIAWVLVFEREWLRRQFAP